MNLSRPIQAKIPGGPLQVIIPGRITQKTQDAQSIVSQHEAAEKWLRQNFAAEINVIRLGEQMSGWVPNRPSMVTAKELILAGAIDLVVANELREIYRNPAEHWRFVFFCIDHDVRVIILFDNIDTADANWEVSMHVASMRTGMEVPAARMRVRRMADQSFSRGGMVAKVKYGYRKLSPHEASTGEFGPAGLRVMKLAECTPVIHEMRERVLRNESPARIAEWLRQERIAPGPYVTGEQWTDRVVEDLLRDPILSGQRSFRKFLHKHHYASGKHRRFRNDGAEIKQWPELAHMTPEQQAEMIAALDRRRGKREFARGSEHVRWEVSRSDSLWPGQHARCAVCGGLMYRFGEFLKCKNVVSRGTPTCWNHVQARIDQIHKKILPWIFSAFAEHRATIAAAASGEFDRIQQRRRVIAGGSDPVAQWTKEASNLRKAIRLGGDLESLVADLREIERKIADAKDQQPKTTKAAQIKQERQATREEIYRGLDVLFCDAARSSFELAAFLRRLIPVFEICPVQAIDCHQVHPRARLTLRDELGRSAAPFEKSVAIDVFDHPEHVKHLAPICAAKMRRPTATLRDLAQDLGVNYMTVKRALDYKRRMRELGLDDAYQELRSCPSNASRWGKQEERRNKDA